MPLQRSNPVCLDVLRTIYFSNVHSVISYGIIFWGNSHFSINIFKIQKRIIRIITNIGAKRFKATLKRYLIERAFYSLDEYYQLQ
jgi:hypothetical protein